MGRRSKFTQPTIDAVIKAISIGATYEIAAESAGITKSTLYGWIRQGLKAGTGKKHDFVRAIKGAESKSAMLALSTIQTEVQSGNLKAAFFLLERRHNYKREQIHDRASTITSEEDQKAALPATLREILFEQCQNLRTAMENAAKKESWQAYAALQRQLLQNFQQIRIIDAEDGQIDKMSSLTDAQLMDEITSAIISLPPIARQRIIADLQALSNNNVIPITNEI